MKFNRTHSGKVIEDAPENEEMLSRRKMMYPPRSEFSPSLKKSRDKNRAKNRVARKSRRKNR